MHGIRALLTALLFVAPECHAVDIDCDRQATTFDKLVCGDFDVQHDLEYVTRTFESVVNASPSPGRLKNGHARWLKAIRDRCVDADCLLKAFSRRIAYLASVYAKEKPLRRGSPDHAKPFEGRWERCELFIGEDGRYRGFEICDVYRLVQNGLRICGERENWASGASYLWMLEATSRGPNRAELALACNTRDQGDDPCEIEALRGGDARRSGAWVPANEEFIVCDGRLFENALNASCNTRGRSTAYLYRPLTDKERAGLVSQAWLKRGCFGDG